MSCGCSGALDMCITALGNPGQNILIPRPGFGLYSCLSVPRGVQARHYNLMVSIEEFVKQLYCQYKAKNFKRSTHTHAHVKFYNVSNLHQYHKPVSAHDYLTRLTFHL